MKISLVLYLARMIEKNRDRMEDFTHAILPPVLMVLGSVGIVFFQSDFSTAVYLFTISFILLYLGGVKWWQLMILLGLFLFLAFVMVNLAPYRMERITAWFAPEKDPLDSGYQILRARNAIRNGRLWGAGWGNSMAKQGPLPQSYSDFLAAVAAEEFGLTGIMGIMLLYVLILVKGARVFFSERSMFCRYGAMGLSLAVFFQAMVNMGVASGLFPATGIPLPLFSSGGSAALTTMTAFGLIAAFSREEEKMIKREKVR
jgi:cell division protein FtsW